MVATRSTAPRRHRRPLTPDERALQAIIAIVMVFASVTILVPLLNIVAQSLSAPDEVVGGRVFLLPRGLRLDAYRALLNNKSIGTGYLNTLFYMVVGTCLNLVVTILCAYPLSRGDFYGRGVLMLVFTFTMLFSGGMIPGYMNIKALGLIDTRWVMILPGAMSVWNMVMMRTYFQTTIPNELYESACLDGSSPIRTLVSIVLPLSGPILAVQALFYAVGHWNAYFNAMLYLKSVDLFNIQLVLRSALQNITAMMNASDVGSDIIKTLGYAEVGKYAMIVITMVPVLVIYPFVQKSFIKGIMIGSLKG